MALLASQRLSKRRGDGTQSDALVNFDVFADLRRLADDDAGSVIDEKALPELRARVDINARQAMRVFGHNAREQRLLHPAELVCESLHRYGKEAGIAEDRFIRALRRRIAVERGLYIGSEHLAHGRYPIEKLRYDAGGLLVALLARGIVAVGAGNLLTIPQAASNLLVQQLGELHHQLAESKREILAREALVAEIPGKNQLPQ